MKKLLLILIVLFLTQITSGQEKEDYVPGRMIRMTGIVKDSKDNTLPFTSVEISSGNIDLYGTISDFDGKFSLYFCSNKIYKDSIKLIFTGFNYEDKTVKMKLTSDTLVYIILADKLPKEKLLSI